MNITGQFASEFERPRRAGDVLVQWRNKQIDPSEKVDRHWHKYKFMTEADALDFMKEAAPNSFFFEYRIYKRPVDKQPDI